MNDLSRFMAIFNADDQVAQCIHAIFVDNMMTRELQNGELVAGTVRLSDHGTGISTLLLSRALVCLG